jgi:hypothetical protein
MAQPFVEFSKHPRRLRQLEVGLPARHVTPEFLRDFGKAAPAAPTGDLPDARFVGVDGLGRHGSLDLTARGTPQGIAEELAPVARATAVLASFTFR